MRCVTVRCYDAVRYGAGEFPALPKCFRFRAKCFGWDVPQHKKAVVRRYALS